MSRRLGYKESKKGGEWLWWLLGGGATAGLGYLLFKTSDTVADSVGTLISDVADDPAIFTVGSASGLTASEAFLIRHESNGNPNAFVDWVNHPEKFPGCTVLNPCTALGLGQLVSANRIKYGLQLGISPDTRDPDEQLALFRAYVADRYGTAKAAEQFWRMNQVSDPRGGWY